MYQNRRVTFAYCLLFIILMPNFHIWTCSWRCDADRDTGISISYSFTFYIKAGIIPSPNTHTGGINHPVLLLRDHQRFGVGKGTSTKKQGGGSKCLSAYSGAVKPLAISEHRYCAYSPASKFSPNKCPFATWMQWLHSHKANGATSAPDMSSELHHICKISLQKKKREGQKTCNHRVGLLRNCHLLLL